MIDGDLASRLATHRALRGLGCRLVDEAADARAALEQLAGRPYDLIICDWVLPTVGGHELLRWIRQTPRLRAVPVVIAAEVTAAMVLEAAEAGVSAFLPRPFGLASLEALLRIFVGRRAPEPLFSFPTYVS